MNKALTDKPAGVAGDDLAQRIRAIFKENPKRMTPSVARELNVAEAEVIRRLPDGDSVEMDIKQWEAIIRAFEELGMVHVIVNTGTVVLEVFGQFGNFSTFGEFFNVQTKSIDMHIRHDNLKSLFAVRKASHTDGVPTLSFQFYTGAGDCAFKVFLTFGGKAPPPERIEQFNTLRSKYAI